MNTIQSNLSYIEQDIGEAHVVWFNNSGSFVLLEKPAYDVLNMYSKNIDSLKIVEYCQKQYFQLEQNIPQFVNEIIEYIDKLNEKKAPPFWDTTKTYSDTHVLNVFSENQYLFGENYITIRYDNDNLKELIHPLFSHLETDKMRNSPFLLELIINEKSLILRCNDESIETFQLDDINYFKGAILKFLYSILHEKDVDAWMMTLHASGVVCNNEAVLFSAEAGSGKSTLSALLQANGYKLLSDDFLTADENACVYSFPSAISVKDGAVDVLSKYYPELINMPSKMAPNGKQVRYIHNRNLAIKKESGYRIKAIVFLKYTSENDSLLELMDKKEAIQLLLKEIWVNPEPKNIGRFFEWINRSSFYRMHYSNTLEALEYVSKIFEK
jgi:hypothetical protein